MSRYKKLFGNSMIFAVGNFGSKIINFVMVPLYTYVLTQKEYGAVDLQITTISLLFPFFTFMISEAILRYVINNVGDISNVSSLFTSGLVFVVVVPFLFNVILNIFIYKFNIFYETRFIFSFLLFLFGIQQFLAQFIRAIGKIKIYAINGILMTVVTATSNVIFLVNFKLGVFGYLLSSLIAYFASIILLLYFCDLKRYFRLKKIDKNKVVQMLKYSVPLIPNASIWWLINGASRYFILYFIGPAGNGLFAVANKIPSLISMLTEVFTQAWQLSAYEEYESDDKSEFYSIVFRNYYQLLFILGCLLIAIVKPLMKALVSDSFYQSWPLISFLVLAVIYQTLAAFIGTIFTAALDTKSIFTSSLLSGVTSVIFNLILLPIFGLIGAGISTLVSFFIMFLFRLIKTRSIININIKTRKFVISNLLILAEIFLLFIIKNIIMSSIICLIVSVFVILINKAVLLSLLRGVMHVNK